MEPKEEYHDPDYQGVSPNSSKEKRMLSEEEKVRRIENIVRREFSKELEYKESEIMDIDQHMVSARRLLHRLRYVLVTRYYNSQKLQLTPGQVQDDVAAQVEPRAKETVSTSLRTDQRRLHPSLRKLLGRKTVDLDEIFKFRSPRNKSRKDYKAMVRMRNYTIAADKNLLTLRPEIKCDIEEPILTKRPSIDELISSKPKKVPRHIEPVMDGNIIKVDQIARNQQKHRYRVIIGNTSKYAPPASSADRSTHKWLLYIRGPPSCPDVSGVVTSIVVRLHDTYSPHHVVTLDKPPFHISRRGWGEFPAKIELHFAYPSRNRPATVEHTIKLDRNYTGLQILGAETIVDVWLYSTEEMLPFVYEEETAAESKNDTTESNNDALQAENDIPMPIKLETAAQEMNEQTNIEQDWMDFFTLQKGELDVDEMIIKPVKKEPQNNTHTVEDVVEDKLIETDIKQEIEYNVTAIVKDEFDVSKVKEELDIPDTPEEGNELNTSIGIEKDVKIEDSKEIQHEINPPKKRIVKYMDPTTGKIYYLEMDINLDINKVQEIVINSNGNTQTIISPMKPASNGLRNVKKIAKKGGVSLLKPEVQNSLKSESNEKQKLIFKPKEFCHIQNDHCYISEIWSNAISYDMSKAVLPVENNLLPSKKESSVAALEKQKYTRNEPILYDALCSAVKKIASVRVAVNYLLSKIPLVSDMARDPDFVKKIPFIVENEQKYWSLDFVKRRSVEWSRAKLINKILTEHMTDKEKVWRTKQILIFGRLHGYHLTRTDDKTSETAEGWSSWQDTESRNMENVKEVYPDPRDICTLSIFQDGSCGEQNGDCVKQNGGSQTSLSVDLTECSDDEIDITSVNVPVQVKTEVPLETDRELAVLPVENEEDRLRFLYLERVCSQIGVELRNEDVGNGFCYSAVHAVLLCAMRRFADELLRSGLAAARTDVAESPPPAPPPPPLPPTVWTDDWSSPTNVRLQHLARAARHGRLSLVADGYLGTTPRDTCAL